LLRILFILVGSLFWDGPVWSMTRPRQIAAPAIKRLLAKRRQRSAPANDDGGSASVDLGARMT